MAFIKVLAALTVLAVASAQQGGYGGGAGYGAAAGYEQEHYEPAHYSFAYAVKDDHTKDIKEHKESRNGDKTEGEYSFLEADGTTRTVKYVVDGKSGFVAQVIRSGHAVHAAPIKKVALVQPVQHFVQPVQHYVQPIQHVAVKPVVVAPVLHQASSFVSGNTFNGARGNNAGYGANNGGYSGSSYVSGGNFGQRAGGFGGNNAGYGANNAGYGANNAGYRANSAGLSGSSYVSGGNFGFGGQQNRASNFGGYNNAGRNY